MAENTKQLIESETNLINVFDKDKDHFELLIESETNLRILYKDMDQFGDLLQKEAQAETECVFQNQKSVINHQTKGQKCLNLEHRKNREIAKSSFFWSIMTLCSIDQP